MAKDFFPEELKKATRELKKTIGEWEECERIFRILHYRGQSELVSTINEENEEIAERGIVRPSKEHHKQQVSETIGKISNDGTTFFYFLTFKSWHLRELMSAILTLENDISTGRYHRRHWAPVKYIGRGFDPKEDWQKNCDVDFLSGCSQGIEAIQDENIKWFATMLLDIFRLNRVMGNPVSDLCIALNELGKIAEGLKGQDGDKAGTVAIELSNGLMQSLRDFCVNYPFAGKQNAEEATTERKEQLINEFKEETLKLIQGKQDQLKEFKPSLFTPILFQLVSAIEAIVQAFTFKKSTKAESKETDSKKTEKPKVSQFNLWSQTVKGQYTVYKINELSKMMFGKKNLKKPDLAAGSSPAPQFVVE